MKRKFLSSLIVLCMLLALFPIPAQAEVLSGTCGENATWHFDSSTKVFTISGTGKVDDNAMELYWMKAKHKTYTVVVEPGITELGSQSMCFSNLRKITLPDTLTTIGDFAFQSTSLTEITIPDSVTSIGKAAFMSNFMLAKVVLPKGLTTIPEMLFYCCPELLQVDMPSGITSIGQQAFNQCRKLTSIQIPAGVTTIGDMAFYECEGLQSVTFLGSAPDIGDDAFYKVSCSVLYPRGDTSWTREKRTDYGGTLGWTPMDSTGILISGTCGENLKWRTEGYKLIIEGDGPLGTEEPQWEAPWSNLKSVVQSIEFTGNVTSIASHAFEGFTALKSVTFPPSLEFIGEKSFYGCSSLESIVIPDSVTAIGNSAFAFCDNLHSARLPKGLDRISDGLFSSALALQSVTIPETVTYIGDGAFAYTSLKNIIIPKYVERTGWNVFYRCEALKKVTIRADLPEIADNMFYFCSSLKQITIPASVTRIGTSAFEGCYALETMYFAGNVPEFGDMCTPSRPIDVYYPSDYRWTWGTEELQNQRPMFNMIPAQYPGTLEPQIPTSVTAPLPDVKDPSQASTIWQDVPVGSTVTLDIPMENPSYGNVAMLLNRDGTYTLLPETYCSEYGVRFRLDASTSFVVVDNSRSFPDIPDGFWAKNEIDYMSSRGYILGKLDGTFGPTETITRKTVAMLLWRLEGSPVVSGENPFSDVKQDRYYDAILWANQAGIVNGYADGTFRSEGAITRQHFAAMLYRYANYKGMDLPHVNFTGLYSFSDYGSVYSWAQEPCSWALLTGLITGRANGTYDPQGAVSRAQLSVILCRMLQAVNAI